MAWNQQSGYNSYQGYGGGGYTRAPFNPNNGNSPQRSGQRTAYRGGYNNQAPARKKSGCRIKEGKNGKPCITAWKKTKVAFLTLMACPNNGANLMAKDGSVITNKKGQEYARWTGTIIDRNTGSVSTHSCLYNLSTGKLYIPELKMVASPNANNGGFWGNSFVSRNNRR